MYTLHKLPEGFIITSDEEIKFPTDIYCFGENVKRLNCQSTSCSHCKKLIAQQYQIDFSALTEEEQRKIGWFDVKKYWLEDTKTISFGSTNKNDHLNNYIKGFQKAQELLSDRKFTSEDMIDFARMCRENDFRKLIEDKELLQTKDLFKQWQSLSQPKSWKVELEMEERCCGLLVKEQEGKERVEACQYCSKYGLFVPKFTDGKVKILKK